jgi:hypothetical protein
MRHYASAILEAEVAAYVAAVDVDGRKEPVVLPEGCRESTES